MRFIPFIFYLLFSSYCFSEIKGPYEEGPVKVIYVTGNIEINDAVEFYNIVNADDKPVLVVLENDGGSLYGAMGISSIVKMVGAVTVVYPSKDCLSTCAVIWLSGKMMLVGDAKVGFEKGFYILNDREKELLSPMVLGSNAEASSDITGIGFAALGLHFNHGLGLGTEFLADIFTRKAEGINYLTQKDFDKYNLQVVKVENHTQKPGIPNE